MKKKLKVIELFAGVGGFRLGLEGYKGKSSSSNYTKKLSKFFNIVWSNQWEPATKAQWASDIYIKQFGNQSHSNEDIAKIDVNEIPEHDILVGGFPCQDYSVANSLRTAQGILGKKGVLWWEIERIISELKQQKKPKYLILENVDRLLKSPANQRGKDFAIMLASLNDHGYAVEWRVINAADFGFPQKRRRVFILAYKDKSNNNILDYQFKANIAIKEDTFDLKGSLVELSKNFGINDKVSKFLNSGVSVNRKVFTQSLKYPAPKKITLLKDILVKNSSEIDNEFWINQENLPKWKKEKNAKKIERISKSGHSYTFSEGNMTFPDNLNSPSRTIITSEGGSSPSRFKHIIKKGNKYRRLTAVELERLNMFPDNHTKIDNITNSKRAFLMGNALVIGVVEKIGLCIKEYESKA